MLKDLNIRNYALIEELEIEFSEGLTVITGETGSGKSVLLDALSLVLGARSDYSHIGDPGRKSIVEARFLTPGNYLEEFFSDHELDWDPDHIYLRRELAPGGKSRAFINDTPASLHILQYLGERLIDVHSQHKTQALLHQDFQLAVLDSFAGLSEEIGKYRKEYRHYVSLFQKMKELLELDRQSRSDEDYFRFLLNELETTRLQPGEKMELEKELSILSHAGEIKSQLFAVLQILSDSEHAVTEGLVEAIRRLSQISAFDPAVMQLEERLAGNFVDLKDIVGDISRAGEGIQHDPERMRLVSERLDIIYRLEQKHRVQGEEELLRLLDSLKERLEQITGLEEMIAQVKQELGKKKKSVEEMSRWMHNKRLDIKEAFEEKIVYLLKELGMPHARFAIDFTASEEPGPDGVDSLRFLFSANPGTGLMNIRRIASGGELSRVMLGIKSMVSLQNMLPTLILDEIDSGVSGMIADRMGRILKSTAKNMQVIVITHLPQLAVQGDHHFQVFKETSDSEARSGIRKLTGEERTAEIARMLSGKELTTATLVAARDLLGNHTHDK